MGWSQNPGSGSEIQDMLQNLILVKFRLHVFLIKLTFRWSWRFLFQIWAFQNEVRRSVVQIFEFVSHFSARSVGTRWAEAKIQDLVQCYIERLWRAPNSGFWPNYDSTTFLLNLLSVGLVGVGGFYSRFGLFRMMLEDLWYNLLSLFLTFPQGRSEVDGLKPKSRIWPNAISRESRELQIRDFDQITTSRFSY